MESLLILILRKVKGIDTARPRVIKFGDNSEVKLTNVSKELADKLSNLVANGGSLPTSSDEEVVDELPPPESVFVNTALGTFKDKDGIHCVAVLKFDPNTKQAKVEELIRAGMDKDEAEERFKILTIQKGVLS